MGNPLAANPRVLHSAALGNADKADGGYAPPAVTSGALGSPTDIAHDRAVYDQGVARVVRDPIAGTPVIYQGTIVPNNPQPGQITEARFLEVLAEEMARQLVGIGQGDGPDPEFVAVVHGMIESLFAVLIPPGARMERVLRETLKLEPDLDSRVEVNMFVSLLLLEVVSPLIRNHDLILNLAERLERIEQAKSVDDLAREAEQLFAQAGIMWFPPAGSGAGGGGPAVSLKKFSFREYVTKVGNTVHLLLQAHYWLRHPNDILMFEDFLVAGPNLLATIWQAGTWAAPYEWIPTLRAALMTAARPGQDTGSTKRPDIFNLSKKHLYEIGTIHQAPKKIVQVAEYKARLSILMPDLHLAGMGPTDWRPFPLYYAGGTTVVAVEVYAPGVIAYQRIGSRVPVTNPLRFWSKEQSKYQQRQAQKQAEAAAALKAAGLAVALIGALLLAVALAPAAAAAGASIAAKVGVEATVALAVGSRLALAR